MNACSSWCGYCGRCTDGEGERNITRQCVNCGDEFPWLYTGDKLCVACDREARGIDVPQQQNRKSA